MAKANMPRNRFDETGAKFLVEVNQGLGVTVGAKAMTSRHEILPKRLVVVDLAVENDPDGAVLIRDRLVAARKVDDAEAPHAETHGAFGVEALIVGPAMPDLVAHRLDDELLRYASKREIPRDSAHDF